MGAVACIETGPTKTIVLIGANEALVTLEKIWLLTKTGSNQSQRRSSVFIRAIIANGCAGNAGSSG